MINILKEIKAYYNLDSDKRIVIFVHNLSYDHTYMSGFLNEAFGPGEILAIKSRKILSVNYDGLEFRCSYLLSNMSLENWGKWLDCKVRKMVGAIDYQLINYPDTPLSVTDWEYMINDVASLREAVYLTLLHEGDTVASMPLTSTGYVRRDCRRATRKDKIYRKWFFKTKIVRRVFQLLCMAFAGGLTHGNRFLGGRIINDVDHVDFKSHYPAREQLNYAPVSPFKCYYSKSVDPEPLDSDTFTKLINTQCCLVHIRFNNLRLKRGVTLPVLSKSKVQNFYDCKFTNDFGVIGTDNGKVINCEGMPAIVCTELDLYWLFDQYENDGWEVLELYVAERGRVPDCILNVINNYFTDKEIMEKGYFRDKQKNRLNGIYGMFATNPIRIDTEYNYDTLVWSETKDLSDEVIDEKLDKYYRNRNNFTFYAHGIYTTAWARFELLRLVRDYIGYDNYIYSDTDSVFYKASPELRARIEQFNNEVIEENKKLGLGVPNRKGSTSYYGTLDFEEHCKEFKFLHAKCYGYTTDDGELKITIAGVTKTNGLPKEHPDFITREKELGSLENLKDGFIFEKCGGTRAMYVDDYPTQTNIDGHNINYASACIILNTTKELGGTVDGFDIWEVDEC